MTGKEKILNYCADKLETTSVEHLEKCRDIKMILEKNNTNYLGLDDCGCSNNFGLNGYEGLCKYGENLTTVQQIKQCSKCWEIALH